jgi:hypothetical protein
MKETLEETAERLATNRHSRSTSAWYLYKNGIIEGAKWQEERMYSEKDMECAFKSCSLTNVLDCYDSFEEFITQFKKK